MRILVTGSEGLIGSALIKELESNNINVRRYDIRSKTPYDILDVEVLEQAVSGCDGIVHLAAVSRVIWGEQDPVLCWQVNEGGTKNIIQAAMNAFKHPWILYASSREVYGEQDQFPVKETAALKPMNVYARTKVASEESIMQVRDVGLQTAIVRYSNVYGSIYDHPDRVLPAFCRAVVKGEALRVDGINHTFDFTYIEDIARGTFAVIERLIAGDHELPPIHFTTGHPYTLFDVAKLACKAGGNRSAIREAPSRSFDVGKFYGDPTLSYELLDWSAKVFPEEGIDRLVRLFKKIY